MDYTEELVDYLEDPLEGQYIFCNPTTRYSKNVRGLGASLGGFEVHGGVIETLGFPFIVGREVVASRLSS
jgi:hypothetical protein